MARLARAIQGLQALVPAALDRPKPLTNRPFRLKDPALTETIMSADVQGREETKLANGGGAFPFWVSVLNVTVFVAILFAIVYGVIWAIGAAFGG